jgi:endonuclease/exonuclease/phosphatase (EEP) superfamily protein YafD
MTQFPRPQTKVYDDLEGPKFEGQFAGDPPCSHTPLTVVTFNINHGLEVAEAIEAFESSRRLRQAGIVLLQEMDEVGTEDMAKALRYNYVYFPASVSRYDRNFGNAILSRWPLNDARKLLLPHQHPVNQVLRIAVRATVDLGDLDVFTYSVHTETYTVPVPHRKAQIAAIVDDIGPGQSSIIVGGDFNTVSGRSIKRMVGQFATIKLRRPSAGAGPTVTKLGIRPSAADHIFTRGFCRVGRGKEEVTRVSDHFPVWVRLMPQLECDS